MTLAEALEQLPVAALRRVASAHALAHDEGATRDELISLITQRLSDEAYVREQFTTLSADEQATLLAARGSAAGELRGWLTDFDHPGAVEALAERGWLYRVFAAAGPLRGEVFVLPEDLQAALPAPAPATETAPPQARVEPPPSERRWSDPAFNLFALASALTRTGGHLEAEVRPWSEEPAGWSWKARWTFLQHLARSAGLLVHRADGRLAASPALARLLDDAAALGDRLRRAYLGDPSYSDLASAGIADDHDLADTLALRAAITDALERLPEQQWIRLGDVSRWLQRTRPTLVREQLTPRGLVLLQARPWPEVEERLLRWVLLGPLYWLGLVATSRDGDLVARRPPSAAGATEPCRWEGATELVAPGRARLGTLLTAEGYLSLRERGRVSRYHLVQSHVAAALGAGGSLAECRSLLERLTQRSPPEEVASRLAAWEQRFGALEVRPSVLLEARSASELEAALSDETVRAFVRARLGDTAAEVRAADALELAAALRQSGHLPRVDASLRLAAEPRRAYGTLIDEQVLEFLLVSLLAFEAAWPERLTELEGSSALLERLQHQFPPERLAALRAAAHRLAGRLRVGGGGSARSRPRRNSARPRRHP